MSQDALYIVRDNAGAFYGPATIATLLQWVGEGRITAEMQVAPQGTQSFLPAASTPGLAQAFHSANALAAPVPFNLYPQNPYPQYPHPTYNVPQPKSSGLAVGSLVCGIGAFVVGCLPCALIAVILGHMAHRAIRREPERYEGGGMATAGLVIGYIGLVIQALVILFVILWFVFVASLVASAPR